ncbi:MAG TPA: CNNM domain-containing protein [Thermoguttaceae bacterium]|nr:CNNM domain-containing protein [Thermoguttaceae bacterium]
MIWELVAVLGLAAVGLFLSALFSGSETGFYRATRLRLVLDALGGSFVARGLLWLVNHPSMFIATTLVGNNSANYLTSLAIVLGMRALVGDVAAAELAAPLVLAPVLFVYGELLPKHLFLHAPNRLLRRVGPLFLVFVVLFFPVSVLLWGMNKIFEYLSGESPEQVRAALARRELRRVLEEGHEVGILHPAQRGLAQGIFSVAERPVADFITPIGQLPRARSDMTKQEVLGLARRYRISVVPVEQAGRQAELIGYLRVIDLALSDSDEPGPLRRLIEIPRDTSHVAALMQMQSTQESLARVVTPEGKTLGIVTAEQLREPMFRAPRT